MGKYKNIDINMFNSNSKNNKNVKNEKTHKSTNSKTLSYNNESDIFINKIINKIFTLYYSSINIIPAYKNNYNFLTLIKKINQYIRDLKSKMGYSILNSLHNELYNIFMKQKKFINLDKYYTNQNYIIIIGDTHGDIETIFKIFSKFNIEKNIFVFLGDYVDRGIYSFEVIVLLFILKALYPANIFLLTGNHESYNTIKVYPSDFWHSKEYTLNKEFINSVFDILPLIAFKEKTLFLHGATPNIDSFEQLINFLNKNQKTSVLYDINPKIIEKILWGDYVENTEFFEESHTLSGRPQHGEKYFNLTMKKLGFEFLIRGHQQTVKGLIYNNRCLTVFSSEYYKNYGLRKGIFIYINNNFSNKFNPEMIIDI